MGSTFVWRVNHTRLNRKSDLRILTFVPNAVKQKGVMEYWSTGVMGMSLVNSIHQRIPMVSVQNYGRSELDFVFPILHYSNTP